MCCVSWFAFWVAFCVVLLEVLTLRVCWVACSVCVIVVSLGFGFLSVLLRADMCLYFQG